MESSTKKKVGGALGGAAVVAAAIVFTAGTFSYFSDQQGAGSGKVQAGTLTLSVGNSNGQIVDWGNAAPGDTLARKTISFENTGSLSGRLRLGVVPQGNGNVFNDAVEMEIHGVNDLSPTSAHNCDTSWCTLTDIASYTKNGAYVHDEGPGNIKSISFDMRIDPAAGNALQGKSGSFKFVADLIQLDVGGPANPSPTFPSPRA